MNPSKHPSTPTTVCWSPTEDNLLCSLVAKHGGKNWKLVATFFPDKSQVQCLQHWRNVLNPEVIKGKGSWLPKEDEKLMSLVKTLGSKRWSTIASNLPGRIGKQCRERWHNHLNPSLSKVPWSAADDELIISWRHTYGNRWADISRQLPGRSDNDIKNRWYSSLRKRVEGGTPTAKRRRIRGPEKTTDESSCSDSSSSSGASTQSESAGENTAAAAAPVLTTPKQRHGCASHALASAAVGMGAKGLTCSTGFPTLRCDTAKTPRLPCNSEVVVAEITAIEMLLSHVPSTTVRHQLFACSPVHAATAEATRVAQTQATKVAQAQAEAEATREATKVAQERPLSTLALPPCTSSTPSRHRRVSATSMSLVCSAGHSTVHNTGHSTVHSTVHKTEHSTGHRKEQPGIAQGHTHTPHHQYNNVASRKRLNLSSCAGHQLERQEGKRPPSPPATTTDLALPAIVCP